jgi:glycosylphosphatidylinositol phospholipase D
LRLRRSPALRAQGGAPFPDWGYACGDSAAAEAAHWEPFQLAAVQYIHATYPQPWDEETQKLVVFLLGIASHYMADLNWHGLGEQWPRWATPLGQGFLKALGGTNYGCNGTLCEVAHSAGDTGAEFMVAAEFDLSWMQREWFLPLRDLEAIYASLNFTVNATVVQRCFAMFFLASHAEKIAGAALYPKYATPSPFMLEQVQQHPVGGLVDNAIFSVLKWGQVIGWLQNATGVADSSALAFRDKCDAGDVDCELRREYLRRALASDGAKAREAMTLAARLGLDESLLEIRSTPRGNLVLGFTNEAAALLTGRADWPRVDLEQLAACVRRGDWAECDVAERVSLENDVEAWAGLGSAAPTQTLTSPEQQAWEFFGSALASGDFDGDGSEDLAVGAPGWGPPGSPLVGRVHVYLGRNATTAPFFGPLPNATLSAQSLYESFGAALAVLDLDLDGFDDLLVSAPNADGIFFVQGYAHDDWRGRLYVFFGSPLGLAAQPDLMIVGDERQENANMAWVLTRGDVDGDGHEDLVVGSPHAYGGNGQPDQAPPNPYPTGSTFVNRGWVAVLLASGAAWRVPGATTLNVNDVAFLSLRGEVDFEFFGAAVAVVPAPVPGNAMSNSSLLLVGSPQHDSGSGRVLGFEIPAGTNSSELRFVLTSSQGLAGLGAALTVASPYKPGQPMLLVSAPAANPGLGGNRTRNHSLNTQAGALWALELGALGGAVALAPCSNDTARPLPSPLEACICGAEPFGRTGAMLVSRRLDSGVDEITVGQPLRTTLTGIEAGSVASLSTGAAFPLGAAQFHKSAAWSAHGPLARGRFGSAALWLRSVPVLLVAAPRAHGADKSANEQAGAVYFFLRH